MAMTLLEAKKLVRDPIKEVVMDTFLEGDLMVMLPFKNIQGSGIHYNVVDALPGIGFRGVNQGHEESVGIMNPQSEALKLFGGDLDVDRAIIDMEGNEARAEHTLLKVRAARMRLEATFINGDSTVDNREFDGLRRRIVGSRLVSNVDAGGPLSLNKLDELLDLVDAPGGSKAIVTNRALARRITQAARNTGVGGYVQFGPEQFGRKIMAYQDVPIIRLDDDNLGNQIMPFTETAPNGTPGANSSIYAVAFGDLLTTGIQGSVNGAPGMSTRDLGEIDSQPVFRTRLDWYISMAVYNARSAARLSGVQNAPATI